MDLATQRQHRTALFIDADSVKVESDYAERVARLLQSLNGPNIKTDVFSVSAPNGNGGVVRIKSLSDLGFGPASVKPSDAELSLAAKKAGYVQVLFTKPAGV